MPWEVYYKENLWWELERFIPEEILSREFFTPIHNKNYMKVFTGDIQTTIYHVVGEYYKYTGVLRDYTDSSNVVNMVKFRKAIDITPAAYSNLKKKLLEFAIIAENEWETYLNPIIGIRNENIKVTTWNLFKEKNKELYNITEI